MLVAFESARYLAYRAGFRHAPGLLRGVEQWGHRVRNRRLSRRLLSVRSHGERPLVEVVAWDSGFVADFVRIVERGLAESVVVAPGGTVRAAEVGTMSWGPPRADVTVVEMPDWQASAFARRGFLVLPKRVTHLERLGGTESREAMQLRRRVARREIAFDVTRDPEHLATFHAAHYLPMVARRHAERGRPTPLGLLRLVFRGGFLVRVFEGGDWVSGALVAPHPTLPRTSSIVVTGVLGGDYRRVSETARLAAVLHARDVMAREGTEICDHLVTRPFALDGLFRKKRTWGTVPTDLPERPDRVALRVAEGTPSSRALLGRLPFLALGPGGLAGVAWGDVTDSARDALSSLSIPAFVAGRGSPSPQVLPLGEDAPALAELARRFTRPDR